jgi:hypothetical protein
MIKLILSTIIIIVMICLSPVFIWSLSSERPLDVAIINKTVPDESYREHQSISWLLNHHRFTHSNGQRYTIAEDYIGLKPNEEEETFEVTPFPGNLNEKDLIYVADTYGVYQDEVPWYEEEAENDAAPPTLISGGLQLDEWKLIKNAVEQHGTNLVMEFNSFASPTSADVRESVTSFLQVDWSGWIGRYAIDLSTETGEVPQWLISLYEGEENNWDYHGEGFILINEFTNDVVVLSQENGDVNTSDIRLSFTDRGKDMFDLTVSQPYQNWFDILEPESEEHILASYEWDLADHTKQTLADIGIPASFPAILHHHVNDANVFYFAGDYANMTAIPSFYQAKGFQQLKGLLASEQFSVETSFFWNTYSPMMTRIFDMAQPDLVNDALTKEEVTSVNQAKHHNISYPARIYENMYEVFKDGEWEMLTLKGVNLGMGKPGTFPGEAGIVRDEYDRWLTLIGEMNANAIRIYTLHPPAFYEALYDYNTTAEEPIYLFHGIWIDEEPLEETLNAFDEEIVATFQAEMKKVVDVIHGNAIVPPEPGHASGTYNIDISPYVIGWIIGIEWYPFMVDQMATDYDGLPDYQGDYVYTEEAAPMEIWLAEQFEVLTRYEIEEYASMRPLSYTNWVTTDNLDQPAEPNEQEDMASVDPNTIKVKSDIAEAGMFASYHVYPYYPDFLNLEEKYTEFIDQRGEPNNYAGYLHDLHAAHEMPVLIAEFGIPASRGQTHRNPFGWDQGFISESEQGEILIRLFDDILEEEMLGGLVFTWQDEWFKRTWNTMDYDNADRRPFWSNAQTNEQQFGLLSFDRLKVKVNGRDDWTDSYRLFEKQDGHMREMTMDHDERYVYIKAHFDELSDAFWGDHQYELYISVREEQGVPIQTIEGNDDQPFLADFRLTIKSETEAALEIAGDYDSFFYDYAGRLDMIDYTENDMENKHNTFHPIRLALNKELTRPDTGETFPFEDYETGELRFGVGDPQDPDYDSLADYYYSEETGILEIRIPWMLLNARDPSQKEFIGDMWEEGIEASMTIDGLDVTAIVANDNATIDHFSDKQSARYTWVNWQLPEYEERLKQSYRMMQQFFESID